MGIVTDSVGPTEPKDPETCTVYNIHKLLLSEDDAKTLADEYRKGISYGDAKKRLLEDYLAREGTEAGVDPTAPHAAGGAARITV